MLVLGIPTHAQTQTQPAPAPPVITSPPTVLVIVYQQPSGTDQVDITYDHLVPHAQAVQECTALVQAARWPASPLIVKDAAAPVQSRSGSMTSVDFLATGVIDPSTHTLPVETFTRAFHSYKRINIVFFTDPQFQFQGARSYADANIQMSLDQHGSSYNYYINITNPNAGSLPPLGTAVQGSTGHRSPWGIFLGILGAAALVGLAVYILTARLTPRVKSEEIKTAETEDRVEVGTKG